MERFQITDHDRLATKVHVAPFFICGNVTFRVIEALSLCNTVFECLINVVLDETQNYMYGTESRTRLKKLSVYIL